MTEGLRACNRSGCSVLFAVKINGGSEHCGQVIQAATRTLSWSARPDDLKLIFIAGNEPFTQGPVDYREACKAAISKGIIVNTIHCRDEATGLAGQWKDGALLADGRFFNIDQNQQVVHIETPHDAQLLSLNDDLNSTYIAYGDVGQLAVSQVLPRIVCANPCDLQTSGFQNRLEHSFLGDRLEQVVESPRTQCLGRGLDGGLPGHHDHPYMGRGLTDAFEQFHAG